MPCKITPPVQAILPWAIIRSVTIPRVIKIQPLVIIQCAQILQETTIPQ